MLYFHEFVILAFPAGNLANVYFDRVDFGRQSSSGEILMNVTAPNEFSKFAPLFEPKDIAELRRRWRVARPVGEPLPPYEELLLGSLGRIDDNIVLLASDLADWNIHRVGRDVRRWIEAPTGTFGFPSWSRISPGRCRTPPNAPSRIALRISPRPISLGTVMCSATTFSRFPWRTAGPPFIAIYVGERGQRYSLVASIFHSSDEGVIALAVIRDEDRRPIDFQIIDLNARATKLLGQSAERLRWRRLREGEHGSARNA